MPETYSSAVWIVRPGEENDFVTAWEDFVWWAAGIPGSGTFRLVRDLGDPARFLSIGSWESLAAQRAWQRHPEFTERLGRPRRYCVSVQPASYALVSGVP
jgi:heme-degrading monooxygenase HmoA